MPKIMQACMIVDPQSVQAGSTIRQKDSNLQDVDGRSRIGSGMASTANADSHPSRQNPTL
jgi:hypothetical protein